MPAIVRLDGDLMVAKIGMTLLMINTRGSQLRCLAYLICYEGLVIQESELQTSVPGITVNTHFRNIVAIGEFKACNL